MVDVTEILVHWYAGRSQSEIASSLGLDRKTVRKYLEPARLAGITPGGAPMAVADWEKLLRGWFPELGDTRVRQVTWPEIEKHHEYIRQMLGVVRLSTLHQRLRDEHGLEVSRSSLRRYVVANLPEEHRRAEVVVLRDDVPPGEEAQVDYGHLGYWIDPVGGRKRRVWAFVMVLAASRHMFVRPVIRMDQQAWTEAHVEAFRYFGGCPQRLIPDNLKTGVTRPDLYDPQINRSYAELGNHYRVLIDPARSGKPRDKARVERPMPYVRDSFWRGREFTSLEQMQAAAVVWCSEVAGKRSCRPLGGAEPVTVFEAVEAEELLPLPASPFVLATWATATVGPDIHVKIGKTLYSVPWQFIGRKVDTRETHLMVQVFHDGQLIATHGRKPRGKQTVAGHYPPEKIAFQMKTPTWCRKRAAEVGPSCVRLIDGLLEINALFRLRGAQGVLGLADKYSPERLEAACGRAIAVGDPSYRTVKGILAAGADIPAPAVSATGDGGAPAFLHGPSQLFANVIPMPTEPHLTLVPMPTEDTVRDGHADDGPAGRLDQVQHEPDRDGHGHHDQKEATA